jgi:hypothetical protein
MVVQNRKCTKCSEGFESGEKYLSTDHWNDDKVKHYHMKCANFDTPMNSESRSEFNSWQIKRLIEENNMLRQRTSALLNELTEHLREHGASEEKIEDLKYEYNFSSGVPLEEKQAPTHIPTLTDQD